MKRFLISFLVSLFLIPFVATAEEVPRIKIEIPNALVRHDFLLGGQPTPEQLAQAAEAGYKAVFFTRGADEIDWDEKAEVEKLGMHWFSLPISGADDLTEENARQFAAIVHDESNSPMVIHCGSGNRVGALFALAAHYVHGKSAEEALAFGKEMGLTRLEPVVREKLGLPAVATE